MAPSPGKKVVVVVRRKAGGHAHHGGSWKVAYADFVTAMMAFFLVMWILGMDQDMRKAIQGYFSNPAGVRKGGGAGSSPIAVGSSPVKLQEEQMISLPRRYEEQSLERIGRELREQASQVGLDSAGAGVEVVRTEEGVRFEVSEDDHGNALFAVGSARMTPALQRVLEALGLRLSAMGNLIVVEGHTDRLAYTSGAQFGNWELSSERANAARRELERAGVNPTRIAGVRGMADRELRFANAPFDPHNRRISIFVRYATPPIPAADSATATRGGSEP